MGECTALDMDAADKELQYLFFFSTRVQPGSREDRYNQQSQCKIVSKLRNELLS